MGGGNCTSAQPGGRDGNAQAGSRAQPREPGRCLRNTFLPGCLQSAVSDSLWEASAVLWGSREWRKNFNSKDNHQKKTTQKERIF